MQNFKYKKELINYSIIFLLFFVFSSVQTKLGMLGLSAGFFCGLIFAKFKIYLVAPLFILTEFLVCFELSSLYYSAFPIVIIGLTAVLHYKLEKPISLLQIMLYLTVSLLPIVVLETKNLETFFSQIIRFLISMSFGYINCLFLSAFVKRKFLSAFLDEEKVCLAVIMTAVVLGVYSINIKGYTPYYVLAFFILAIALKVFSGKRIIVTAIILGSGAGLRFGDIGMVSGLVMSAVVAYPFAKRNIYFGSAVLVLVSVFLGYYFNAFGVYNLYIFLSSICGVMIALLLPKQVNNSIKNQISDKQNSLSERKLININRQEMKNKIENLANIFYVMSASLYDGVFKCKDIDEEIKKIADKIYMQNCCDCEEKELCSKICGKKIIVHTEYITKLCFNNNGISQENIASLLTTFCPKKQEIYKHLSTIHKKYMATEKEKNVLENNRKLISEQMLGVGGALSQLMKSFDCQMSEEIELETAIKENLLGENILCDKVIVETIDNIPQIFIAHRGEADTSKIASVLLAVFKTEFVALKETEKGKDNFHFYRFVKAPKFGFCYGVCSLAKNVKKPNGDCVSVDYISVSKALFALCDGMGSGESAKEISNGTIELIENFYKVGYENETILRLTNSMLASRKEENFSCLDMCMLDLESGVVEFIKLGGVTGLIKRRNIIEQVDTESLPIGMLDSVTPYIEKKVLSCGDMVFMMSDGIMDTLTLDGVKAIIKDEKDINPQSMANKIGSYAVAGGIVDDSTVLVFKLTEY